MSASGLPSLSDASWLTRPETQRVLTALTAAGHGARAVGGCVRNALMGLPVTDIDVATTALPAQTQEIARAAGMAAIPTGIEHGTITVVANHVPFEVTTLRRDVATDGRRAVVAFTADWAEDAARRDFTMNALYCDGRGQVFDPLGGYADLVARRVRFIGDPHERIREDYLRILRFFRFHATYGVGVLDADGGRACVQLRAGLRLLSAERVGAEIMKLLVAERAVEAVRAMFDLGLLVDVLGGVPRLARFERLVTLEQALGCVPDAGLRLAALAVHDVHDCHRLETRLRLSGEQRKPLILAAPKLELTLSGRDARIALFWLERDAYRHSLLLRWAQSGAPSEDARWRHLWAIPDVSPVPPFPLLGRDLVTLGLAPGPKVGEVLRELQQHWIDGDFAADAQTLLAMARARI